MGLIASIIAYLVTAAGISVGFLLVIGALLTPPAPPLRNHDASTQSTPSRPALHALNLSSQARSAGHSRAAPFKHVAARKFSWRAAKSHAPLPSEREYDWAYRRVPPMLSRRPSYAQDFSGGTFFR